MKKALFVTGALAAFALVTGSVTSGSSELTGPGTIKLTTRQVGISLNNTGSVGRGPGDVLLIRELLYNRGIRKEPIGHSEMVCTYTGMRWQQCSGTYFLPRGKIVVAGSLRYREFFKLAVVGGTDLYDNVRGSVSATMYSRNPRRSILIFRLTV
ncbi:MAG TPA: hypothetical protein VH420_11050 [Gaiellaceae bacterium]|jgi:hypothetical protein